MIYDHMSINPNCESIGKSHDYEVIGVKHISPYNTDLVITMLPNDALVRYSAVTYECNECGCEQLEESMREAIIIQFIFQEFEL